MIFLHFLKQYEKWVWAMIGLCVAFVFNETNLATIREANPENIKKSTQSILLGHTVTCVEDEYYLTQPNNFLAGMGWRFSLESTLGEGAPPVGSGSYFRRTPGYSLIYLFFVGFLGISKGLACLKYFQLLLYALSAACFWEILKLSILKSLQRF